MKKEMSFLVQPEDTITEEEINKKINEYENKYPIPKRIALQK